MNRFKFRVWHKPLKTMHYNDFIVTATGYMGKIYQQDDYMMKFNQEDLEFDKQCILMQCTGLKDKNGKLIYEGDVVRENISGIYKISYRKCAFYLENNETICPIHELAKTFSEKRLEVIGNIYQDSHLLENAELLKE